MATRSLRAVVRSGTLLAAGLGIANALSGGPASCKEEPSSFSLSRFLGGNTESSPSHVVQRLPPPRFAGKTYVVTGGTSGVVRAP